MKQIWSHIFVLICAGACATTEPVPVATAKLEDRPPKVPINQVMAAKPLPRPQPRTFGHGYLCRPMGQADRNQRAISLGFHITEIQVIENRTNAELIIKRESLVGAIPMKTLHFNSTRYHPDKESPYGEWDGSEHWLRLEKTQAGYKGRFVYESEFSFEVGCR